MIRLRWHTSKIAAAEVIQVYGPDAVTTKVKAFQQCFHPQVFGLLSNHSSLKVPSVQLLNPLWSMHLSSITFLQYTSSQLRPL